MRFISDDGKVFNTAEECANYENSSKEAEARRAEAEAQRREDERRKVEEERAEREKRFREEKAAAYQKLKDAEKAYMEAQKEYIQKYCMNDGRTGYQTGQQEDPFKFMSSLADLLTDMLR